MQGVAAYQTVLKGLGALAVAHGYLPALDENADELREDRVVDAVRDVRKLDVHAVHRLARELQRDCRGGARLALLEAKICASLSCLCRANGDSGWKWGGGSTLLGGRGVGDEVESGGVAEHRGYAAVHGRWSENKQRTEHVGAG